MNDLIGKLEYSITKGRARHAYLFTGADSDLTLSIAKTVAALILNGDRNVKRLEEQPDLMLFDGGISISQFRDEIQPEIYRESYGKTGRVVIFRGADRLSQMVQNAMLKVIEEPPANTYFILTGNEYGILPTIRSRCTVVRCPAADRMSIENELLKLGVSQAEARSYAAMSGYMTGRAVRLCADEQFRSFRKELYSAFISAMKGVPDYRVTKAKRERADWSEGVELLLLFAHDLLCCACSTQAEYCRDYADEIKKLSLHFTIGDIGCIIDKLTECGSRTASNASGGAAFDRLLSETAALALSKKNRA